MCAAISLGTYHTWPGLHRLVTKNMTSPPSHRVHVLLWQVSKGVFPVGKTRKLSYLFPLFLSEAECLDENNIKGCLLNPSKWPNKAYALAKEAFYNSAISSNVSHLLELDYYAFIAPMADSVTQTDPAAPAAPAPAPLWICGGCGEGSTIVRPLV